MEHDIAQLKQDIKDLRDMYDEYMCLKRSEIDNSGSITPAWYTRAEASLAEDSHKFSSAIDRLEDAITGDQ